MGCVNLINVTQGVKILFDKELKSTIFNMMWWVNGTKEWQRATAFFHLRCVRDDDLTLELHAEFSSEVLVHSDYRILILGPKIRQSSI